MRIPDYIKKGLPCLALSVISLAWAGCRVNPPVKILAGGPKIEGISLPPGFSIHLYAGELKNARSLCLSPDGTLFVSTRNDGRVYALRDEDGDYFAETRFTLASGLNMPNGVAFLDGDLYVAEVDKIWRYPDIESRLADPPRPVLVTDDLPDDTHHGWKYINFGPDGKLYVPVGAPCNICDPELPYAALLRMDPDGSNREVVAQGIRNTVGFDWDPADGKLWFTDNGRDWMGDDKPLCELNRVDSTGQHFGYPYCHQGDLPDPEYGKLYPCKDFTPPYQNLGPHVAPLGMEFYEPGQFPAEYARSIFIAEHGSWNRSKPIGYRIMQVDRSRPEDQRYTVFAEGWLTADGNRWGRPVDLEWMPDGSLLISDDFGDAVYRVVYEGNRASGKSVHSQ